MSLFAPFGKHGLLLEAEVAPKAQTKFEKRYKAATKHTVSPGKPQHYQHQANKWGTELRVYFNDPGMAVSLAAMGRHVEHRRNGYMAGQYRYRVNDSDLWWELVESHGLRLGTS
jgi:hypothetical protein